MKSSGATLYEAAKIPQGEREASLARHAPLVKRIAYRLLAKLPASVELDDLVQAGMIGLLDAVNRYDDAHGAQFETYAAQRIRGAMLDELRDADWLPRSCRKSMRDIESAISRLQQRLGRAPAEPEVARELDMPLAQYQAMLHEARGYQLVHYDELAGEDEEHFLDRHCTDTAANPLERLADASLRAALIGAIGELPEREKLVMSLIYEEEMNLKEIGKVLGVSESRVCQLHTQAIARLRSQLRAEDE